MPFEERSRRTGCKKIKVSKLPTLRLRSTPFGEHSLTPLSAKENLRGFLLFKQIL